MMQTAIRLAVAALSRNIYAGRPNKAGDGFAGQRHDVTSDALKAVIEHIGEDRAAIVNVDGKPAFEISVKRLDAALSLQQGR